MTDIFELLGPEIQKKARLLRAIELYEEKAKEVFEERDEVPHCDNRVLHSPGTCDYCDQYASLQLLRQTWGIPFTDELQANESLLLGDGRSRKSAETWGGNQPRKER